MGYRESQALDRCSLMCLARIDAHISNHRTLIARKPAVLYAWNSWRYHGVGADDSRFMELAEELFRWDKSLWVEAFPEDHHHPCIDGLDNGIAWLKVSYVLQHKS